MIRSWIKSNFEEEIDQLINLETANRDEIVTRHTILIIMCASGSWYFEAWFPVSWVAIYSAASILIHLAFIRLASSRSLNDYTFVLVLTFFQLMTFRVMILYLWFYPHPAGHFYSVFLLLASMRYSTNLKSRVKSYMIIHAKGDLTVFAVIAFDFFFIDRYFEGAFLLGLAALCTIIYYLVTLWQNLAYLKEMQLLEERTRQSQKMEAVGRLTGGVAHDFNNILTVVMGNLELHDVTDDEKEKRLLLHQTRDAAKRAADLTSQLLAFSRQSRLVQDVQDIPAVFDQVKTLSQRLLPATFQLTHSVAPWTAKIRTDATQLEVALINLIINARDAMLEGGKLRLVAQNTEIQAPHPIHKPGSYVRIDLTDEGGGISDKIIDKVTEPFFTTKPVGKGSGLGLSMVKGFAEQSGGFLEISTVPDTSTTISIYLPAVSDEIPDKPNVTPI